jgi:PRTRC genetic system protein C
MSNLTVTETERRFTYNGVTLLDPSPGMSAEQVRDFYTTQYPELATATITGPTEREGRLEYAFARAIGTKG